MNLQVYLTITILTGTIEHIKATERERTSMPLVKADEQKNGKMLVKSSNLSCRQHLSEREMIGAAILL